MLVYIQMNCVNNRLFNSPVALQLFYIWKIFFFVEKNINFSKLCSFFLHQILVIWGEDISYKRLSLMFK